MFSTEIFSIKCEELDKVSKQLKTTDQRLLTMEAKISSQNRKTDDEKVNLMRSMNILQEEIREKDREIKALLEEKKTEDNDELIQKILIKGVLMKYLCNKEDQNTGSWG